jgi:ankyrin repeat protein
MLLQRGAKVDVRADAVNTAPVFAAAYGQAALIPLLGGAGASVNFTNNFRQSPLYIAVANGAIGALEAVG